MANFDNTTCQLVHERNKLSLDNLDYEEGKLFTDTHFPTTSALYWASMPSELYGVISTDYEDMIEWVRASEAFPDNPFWGSNGITPEDVRQGVIGDCWFMVAASALAEKPKRLEKIFLNVDAHEPASLNRDGFYAISLYTLGVKHTIMVDDYLPLQEFTNSAGDPEYETLFGMIAYDQSMWGVILEKAFAKLHGNYQHLIGGDPREASRTLTGAPTMMLDHTKDEVTADYIWSELLKHDFSYNMIYMNSREQSDGAKRNACGLQNGHAYVVLKAIELSNGERLIKMRNPWGSETYKCDYSDSCPLWTDDYREEAGATYTAVNEGIFFMELKDYYRQAESTVISYDTTGWYNDHFLMLNDQTKSPGKWPFCGKRCTRHMVTVISTVDQPIYITVYTWDTRSYPKECQK